MPRGYHVSEDEITVEDTEYVASDDTAAICHCLMLIHDELVEIRETLNQ